MSLYDFSAPRLFLDHDFSEQASLSLDSEQMNYVLNVMRMKNDSPLIVFNGREGEWQARLQLLTRKKADVILVKKTREQTIPVDLHYLFSPLKHARLDYMVQKAVEMGVSCLGPVLTDYCQVTRVNLDRMRANSIEAAEQCGILSIPTIQEAVKLDVCLNQLDEDRILIFCDEDTLLSNPIKVLQPLCKEYQKLAVLIGPEGGFSSAERERILRRPHTVSVSLGPRILRADTAAVAALTLIQACLGDWQ